MPKFKIGEKAVYVGFENRFFFNIPEKNEIVIISEIDAEGDYRCFGYEQTFRGTNQWFKENELKKLDYNFADCILRKIKNEMLVNL